MDLFAICVEAEYWVAESVLSRLEFISQRTANTSVKIINLYSNLLLAMITSNQQSLGALGFVCAEEYMYVYILYNSIHKKQFPGQNLIIHSCCIQKCIPMPKSICNMSNFICDIPNLMLS